MSRWKSYLLMTTSFLSLMFFTFALVPLTESAIGIQSAPMTSAVPSDKQAETLEVIGQFGGKAETFFIAGNYAYVGFGPKMVIIDLTSLEKPEEVGHLILPALIQDIYVVGNYAYVAAGNLFYLINISDPTTPTQISAYETIQKIRTLEVAGDEVYISRADCLSSSPNSCSSALEVVNLSEPTKPLLIASYDRQLFSYILTISGDYVYFDDDGSVRILDISNPAAPMEVARIDLNESESLIHDITVVGDYAYVASNQLFIFNISNPALPVMVGTEPTRFNDLSIEENTLIATVILTGSYVPQRLYFFDISNPIEPLELSFYDMNDEITEIKLIGDRLYTTVTLDGLRILDSSTASNPTEIAFYNPAQAKTIYDMKTVGDYAYLIVDSGPLFAEERRLIVLDISDPTMPSVASLFDLPRESEKLEVVGEVAYLPVETGLLVLDIQEPLTPSQVSLYNLTGGATDVTIRDDLAYVVNYAGLYVLNIENPAAPLEVGSFSIEDGASSKVDIQGHYAYLVTDPYLLILDITDPTSITQVGFYERDAGEYNDVIVKHDYLYASWGGCSYVIGQPICEGGLDVIKTSNPTTPTEVASYTTNRLWARGLALRGNQLYIAYGTSGLRVLDISSPTNPVERFFYESAGYSHNVTVANDLILVADDDGGLLILQHPPLSITGQIKQANGLPFGEVKINAHDGLTATSDASGSYTLTNLLAEPYLMTPTLTGYAFLPPTRTVMTPPSASHQDFTILPAPVSTMLVPSTTTNLTYTDTQGLPTEFTFPPNAVTQTTKLIVTPTLLSYTPQLPSTSHAFELVSQQENEQLADFTFNAPITLTIEYSDFDIRLISDENQLVFWWWQENHWQEATETCQPPSSYNRDVANNTISLPICQTGHFTLLGPTNQIHLPLISKQ